MHKLLIAITCIAAWADPVRAEGLKSLETFIKATQSGRAEFTQTVTGPPRDGQAARVRNSSGTFEFHRPQKFRFQYAKPFEQTIVADGTTLWLHDVDLNQVTQRPQAQTLAQTPAALLASATDITGLQRDFALQNAADADGLEWVSATPKAKDGQLQAVKIGFTKAGQLAALDVLDNFGQRSVMRFANVQTNQALPASVFRFVPPAGADVVRP